MNPTDYRNATWEEVQQSLRKMLLKVYDAWLFWGPGTTEQIAAKAGISILTFRPRSTDLFQMGLLRLADRAEARDAQRMTKGGVYAAVGRLDFEKNKTLRNKPVQEQLALA